MEVIDLLKLWIQVIIYEAISFLKLYCILLLYFMTFCCSRVYPRKLESLVKIVNSKLLLGESRELKKEN